MKLLNKIRFSALFCFSMFMVYSQNTNKHNDPVIIDSNPVYIVSGNGISKVGSNEKLSISGSLNNNEVEIKDNSVKVKKDGIYKITLSTNLSLTERKQKDLIYYVILNDREAFNVNQRNLPVSGEYFFQIQLKANDLIAFNVKGNDEIDTAKLQNKLKIQFADPKLIKIVEKH